MILRLQIVLTFVILMAAVAGVSYSNHRSNLTQAMTQDADLALRRAASAAELERVLEESSLREKAEFVGDAPDIASAITTVYEAPTESNPTPTKNTSGKALHDRHLKVHEKLRKYEIVFEKAEMERFKKVKQLDLPLRHRRPIKNDIFLAVDADSVGLAALGKDLYKWYGKSIGNDYPIVQAVLQDGETRTALWRWSFDEKEAKEKKSLYLVAVSAVRGADDKIVGAMVVGNLISDGMAQNARKIVAGVADQDLSEKEEKRVMATAPELVYFQGKKIVASTFSGNLQPLASKALFETLKILEVEGTEKSGVLEDLDGRRWLVRARMLPRHRTDKEPAGIILVSDLSAALKPLEGPGRLTLMVAILSGLLGIILFLVYVQLFLKPIADVEQGIQEVIAGNRDYEFTAPPSNRVALGLAQQLNLMSAFLQGKKMPDDDDAGAGGSWGDLQGGGRGTAPQGHAQVRGVSMADLMGKKPKGDDDA